MQSLDRHRAATIASPLGRIVADGRPGCCSRRCRPCSAAAPSIVVRERPILDRSLCTRSRNTVTPSDRRGPGPDPGRGRARPAASRVGDHVLPRRRLQGPAAGPGRGGFDAARPGRVEGAQGVYRRAIEYMLETAHRQAKAENGSWTDVLARAGIGVQGRVAPVRSGQVGRGPADPPVRDQGIPPSGRARGARGARRRATWIRCREMGRAGGRDHRCPGRPVRGPLPQVALPGGLGRPAARARAPNEPLAVLELHDPVLHARPALAVGPRRPELAPGL